MDAPLDIEKLAAWSAPKEVNTKLGRRLLRTAPPTEEFIAARSRHPMRVRMKTGVKKDGTIVANEMYALSDTGAYGCHALTVTGNTGQKSMGLYNAPNIKFHAHVVYTNTPPFISPFTFTNSNTSLYPDLFYRVVTGP